LKLNHRLVTAQNDIYFDENNRILIRSRNGYTLYDLMFATPQRRISDLAEARVLNRINQLEKASTEAEAGGRETETGAEAEGREAEVHNETTTRVHATTEFKLQLDKLLKLVDFADKHSDVDYRQGLILTQKGVVGTDSIKLAYYPIDLDVSDVAIPIAAIEALSYVAARSSDVGISISADKVGLEADGYICECDLIKGDFPCFDQLLIAKHELISTGDVLELTTELQVALAKAKSNPRASKSVEIEIENHARFVNANALKCILKHTTGQVYRVGRSPLSSGTAVFTSNDGLVALTITTSV